MNTVARCAPPPAARLVAAVRLVAARLAAPPCAVTRAPDPTDPQAPSRTDTA
ncbi:hypothetical protein SAMN04488238_10167 [Roseicitreum antarcticum]|uniref:Uncharacterized protein n=1 Tax=Roseicitreum antarcticum TaxID=564137 RepID=A0A1H2QPJ0_9RHOB|nr:hypothetical protein SAMN04488238_10167 [Roseicitreum antarcticum]